MLPRHSVRSALIRTWQAYLLAALLLPCWVWADTIAGRAVNVHDRDTITALDESKVLHKGAIFIDKTVRLNRDAKSSMAPDPQEIDANKFSAALLMPEKMVSIEAPER